MNTIIKTQVTYFNPSQGKEYTKTYKQCDIDSGFYRLPVIMKGHKVVSQSEIDVTSDLKAEAHQMHINLNRECVILSDGSVWPCNWIQSNPQAADQIIYSTLD